MGTAVLHRTTIGVVGILIVVAVVLGLLRGTVISKQGGSGDQKNLNSEAVAMGATLFKTNGCAHCHATDSAQNGIGPGLKGLFKTKGTLVDGRPVTDETVRDQIKKPYKNMPPFAGRLTEKEMDQLLLYLKTL